MSIKFQSVPNLPPHIVPLLPLLLMGLGSCGPQKPAIPDDVEVIARSCYEELVTHERTPTLNPSAAMEDGTYLILWSIVEFPNERGSCTVDGSGTVLLLTNNGDQQLEENPAEESPGPSPKESTSQQ